MSDPTGSAAKFPAREDAAWLLLGFAVFGGTWGLVDASTEAASGHPSFRVAVPLVILLVVGGAILEIALRRLQTQLTGRRLSPWPAGMVSVETLMQAISPSTMSEAARRIGLNGRLVTGALYALLAVDVVALVIVTA